MIDGERVISRNGQNQCKIFGKVREDVNLLIPSDDLKSAGYKLYIPFSFISKKAFNGMILD